MAELITLDEVKNYLRIDFSEDDTFLSTLIVAARNYCESYLNRPLLSADMTEETTWEIPETIKLAMLILISHWYENRMPIISNMSVNNEISFSVTALLFQHRHIMV